MKHTMVCHCCLCFFFWGGGELGDKNICKGCEVCISENQTVRKKRGDQLAQQVS